MHKLQVLAQMVLPVKGALTQSPFLTRRVIMIFDMSLVGVRFATEDARHLPFLRIEGARPVGRANPPLERQMQRLFMPLPVVFGPKRFRAEGALEGLERS
jgi:hypothetical protein